MKRFCLTPGIEAEPSTVSGLFIITFERRRSMNIGAICLVQGACVGRPIHIQPIHGYHSPYFV